MEGKNRMTVRICDREYTFVASEPVEYIQKVAAHLNAVMSGIAVKNPNLSYVMTAILAAMNMTDCYFKTQTELENLKSEAAQLRKRLEESGSGLCAANAELERVKAEMEGLRLEIARLQQKPQSKANINANQERRRSDKGH